MLKWPQEALSAFVRTETGILVHIPLENVHEAPEDRFRAHPQQVADICNFGYTFEGIHHSHPRCNRTTGAGLHPSAYDLECQQAWQVPFYITCLTAKHTYLDFFGWGDQLPIPPLKNRDFRNGVTDCYALVRHATFVHSGVVLPDGPRANNWWDDPLAENPILTNLTAKGFVSLETGEDLHVGDPLLFAIKGGHITHCGFYIGDEMFLHHLHGRVSRTDSLQQWKKFFKGAARYAPGAQGVPA